MRISDWSSDVCSSDLIDVIDELVTKTPEANFASLPNGTYFVRVTAIDANGLEGRPSTYAFERRLNRISTSLEERRAGRYRRSEERRVGTKCVSTCRSGCSQYH